jgi:hypothetical protein
MADLERLDPESEAQYQPLAEIIEQELAARVAAGDDPRSKDGQNRLAELIADAILDHFVVRARQTPRYRWAER